MISSITGENIDIVRIAIDIFIKLKLMENLENGALFMNEIQNMVGVNQNGQRLRESKEKKKSRYKAIKTKCA